MELANLLYGQGEQQPAQGGVPAVPAGVMAAPAAAPIRAPEPPFTEKLRSDPALMQSMLMMGARLMQTSGYSQDPMKDIGDAVMIGSATHNMMKENEYANARADEEMRRRNALADAQIGQTVANTEQTQLETSQKRQSFPETQKKAALEIKRLEAEGKRAEAMAIREAYRSDPARLAQEWNLDVAKDKASIAASGASAASSMSNVEFNRERTKGARLENSAFETLANPLANDRAVEAASRGLNKGKTDKTGARAQQDAEEARIKRAHPDWTDQRVAEEALARGGTSKTDPVTLARKVLEMPEEFTPEDVENAKQIVGQTLAETAGRKAGKAGGGTPKPGAAPAAAPAKATTLPPLNTRVIGQVYPTPMGQMKWTAAGWVK